MTWLKWKQSCSTEKVWHCWRMFDWCMCQVSWFHRLFKIWKKARAPHWRNCSWGATCPWSKEGCRICFGMLKYTYIWFGSATSNWKLRTLVGFEHILLFQVCFFPLWNSTFLLNTKYRGGNRALRSAIYRSGAARSASGIFMRVQWMVILSTTVEKV